MVSPRIRAIRKIISGKQAEYALVTDVTDIEYICGFRASSAALLVSSAHLELFTDFRYEEAVRAFCRGRGNLKFTVYDKNDFKYLRDKVKQAASVCVQSDVMTVDQYRNLKRALSKAKIVPLSGEISDVSIAKLDDEISRMRRAARIGDGAFRDVLPLIKCGMTERELARIVDSLCAKRGSQKPAFDTIVLFGDRSALPHGQPGQRKLRWGDFVLLDFGCVVDGFCSDMTRTVIYGRASDEQCAVYDTVMRAQELAREAARAGAAGAKIDQAARDHIKERGFIDHFKHATGHGVGLNIHESPRIAENCETKLVKNSVITIEPGIYIPGTGGVRIEDMAVLKAGGAELLTHSPRKLMELPL